MASVGHLAAAKVQLGKHRLIRSVERVAAGESLLDPEMTEKLFARIRSGEEQDPLLSRLSPQEQRILEMIAQGKSSGVSRERRPGCYPPVP